MQVKKNDLIQVWRAFEILGNTKQLLKFSYFIAKNKGKIKEEVDILKSLSTPSDKYQMFDTKRVALAVELSDKDEEGTPIIQNNSYSMKENEEEFGKRLEDLKKKHKETIQQFEIQIKQYNEIVQETVEFDGYVISLDHLPEEIEPSLLELFIKIGLIKD